MNKDIRDLAYGMTIEVNGVNEAYDMDLDYGMTEEVSEASDDLSLDYGMTIEE